MTTQAADPRDNPAPVGTLDWQHVAITLGEEVERLRLEVDRLSKLGREGDAKAPLTSRADQGHPLWPLWVELGLDDIMGLRAAWIDVTSGECPKCHGRIAGETEEAPCAECGLVFYASDGHFAIDTIERAQERGPDT